MPDRPSSTARPELEKTWKKTLAIVWAAQFVSHLGFAFGLPFAPFYLQADLGVGKESLSLWIAMFGAAPPLLMIFSAPLWGALADKFGRRKMLMRSYIGGMIALGLMGCVANPIQLIILRLVQGAFCGTVSAAQTLVATNTPSEHNGFALGSLNSANFSGTLAGAFIGGFFAEWFGYRVAFMLSGGLMLISFMLVLFFVEEHFMPVIQPRRGYLGNILPKRSHFLVAFPILGLMAAVIFCRLFDYSFIPLLVQDIHGSLQGASGWTGALQAFCGAAGVISGFLMGWLADRRQPGSVAVISAVVTAVFMGSLYFAHSMTYLFSMRFIMIFASSGLDPALQIWLCKKTVSQTRGTIFGLACSFRCIGQFLAPIAAGFVVNAAGLRAVFVVGPVLYLLVMAGILLTMRRYSDVREF